MDGVAIDTSSAQSIRTFMIPSTLVVLLLCRWCLRSWWLTIAVMVTALFGEVLVLGLVSLCGVTMNAVFTVMVPWFSFLRCLPEFIWLTITNDEVRLRGQRGAAQRALLTSWIPCLLAALATGIGLCPLVVSSIAPVKHFGIFASIGLVVTTVILFLVLPGSMLRWLTPRRQSSLGCGTSGDDFWQTVGGVARRTAWLVSVVGVGGMILSIFGLVRMESSVKVLNLLVPESRIVRDYTWLEENVGSMVPIEIVLKFDPACSPDLLQRIELLRWVQGALDRIDNLDGTMSAATFFPAISAPGGARRTVERSVLRRRLTAQQKSFVDSHYLQGEVDEEQSWRISARAPALGGLDYGIFLEQLQNKIEPVLSAYQEQGKRKITALYMGIIPLVFNVERAMLSDLIGTLSYSPCWGGCDHDPGASQCECWCCGDIAEYVSHIHFVWSDGGNGNSRR